MICKFTGSNFTVIVRSLANKTPDVQIVYFKNSQAPAINNTKCIPVWSKQRRYLFVSEAQNVYKPLLKQGWNEPNENSWKALLHKHFGIDSVLRGQKYPP